MKIEIADYKKFAKRVYFGLVAVLFLFSFLRFWMLSWETTYWLNSFLSGGQTTECLIQQVISDPPPECVSPFPIELPDALLIRYIFGD
mgnify:FL=1